MRRLALLALTCLALVGAAAPVLAARGPSRVQVSALEFEYRLSRPAVRQGPALIELVNFGEDEHDLMIRRIAVRVMARARSSPFRALSIRLRPGSYRLWCEVADHRVQGMRATLRVRR